MRATIVSRQGGRRYRQASTGGRGVVATFGVGPAGLEISINPGSTAIAFSEKGPTVPVTLTGVLVDIGQSDSITLWTWEIDGAVVGTGQTLNTQLTVGPHLVILTALDNTLPAIVVTSSMMIAVGVSPASRVFRSRVSVG